MPQLPSNDTDPELLRRLRLQIRALERQVAMLGRQAVSTRSGTASDYDAYESHFASAWLYHITPAAYFAAQPNTAPYLPEPYAKDGFIHCTRGADLLILVANRFYRSIPGAFVMLAIDAAQLTSPLKFEITDTSSPLPFPHIYGPLNRKAIVEVVPMPRAADGTFLVPPFADQANS